MSLKSPALAGWFFTTNATWEALGLNNHGYKGVRPNFWLSQLTYGCHPGANVSALYSEVSFITIEFCQNPNDMAKENFVWSSASKKILLAHQHENNGPSNGNIISNRNNVSTNPFILSILSPF